MSIPKSNHAKELQAHLGAAKQYVATHLAECCREVIASQATGLLGSGRVREAAALYAKVNVRGSLKMALDEVATQAMQQVAVQPQVRWKRTCQECGHWQLGSKPPAQLTLAFRNAKCRHCKSEALDYGSDGWTLVDGKLMRAGE
jgi:hypothetical protein